MVTSSLYPSKQNIFNQLDSRKQHMWRHMFFATYILDCWTYQVSNCCLSETTKSLTPELFYSLELLQQPHQLIWHFQCVLLSIRSWESSAIGLLPVCYDYMVMITNNYWKMSFLFFILKMWVFCSLFQLRVYQRIRTTQTWYKIRDTL